MYIGVLTASACLPENRLGVLAGGLKKAVTWCLTTALLAFTLYLSAVRVVSGAADGLSVKMAKAAISGVVPVVGGIIAEASETVLAGAGMLRSVIGVGGMLAILAACSLSLLQLGVQYLIYKLTAFWPRWWPAGALPGLIDGLGGAFAWCGHDRRLRASAAHFAACLCGGGGAMIGAVREWLTALVVVSMLLSAVQALIPEGSLRRIASFTGGLVLLTVLLRPALGERLQRLELPDYAAEVAERQEELERAGNQELSARIAERTQAYISDKAASLGLSGSVQVETKENEEGLPLPWSVRLALPESETMAAWIEGELGIPRERQVWYGGKGEN